MKSRTTAFAPLAVALMYCCLAPFAIRASDPPPALTAAVDRAFHPLLQQFGVPGIAVAVTIDRRHYFFNYGIASKESHAPVTEDTLFEIGSISKTFTATLVSYAQATGKLALDDHPSKYMPQLRGRPIDKARLLHLGTYTAGGLPLQFPDSVNNDAEMVEYFQQWNPTAAPGTQRQYSNPSIGLLGHIAALALNADFAGLFETKIFPALGLAHTYLRVPAAAMANYAWGYNNANKPVRVSPGVFEAEAYGVKTSAADLIRYIDCNISTEALDPLVGRAIEGTHIGHFRIGDMVQGLGWEQYPYPIPLDQLLAGNSTSMIMESNPAAPLNPPQTPAGPALFNKTGSTAGFGAYAAFVPKRRIGIVMLANKNFPIPARVTAAHAVLQQLSAK